MTENNRLLSDEEIEKYLWMKGGEAFIFLERIKQACKAQDAKSFEAGVKIGKASRKLPSITRKELAPKLYQCFCEFDGGCNPKKWDDLPLGSQALYDELARVVYSVGSRIRGTSETIQS
jgi:hypothetical protein